MFCFIYGALILTWLIDWLIDRRVSHTSISAIIILHREKKIWQFLFHFDSISILSRGNFRQSERPAEFVVLRRYRVVNGDRCVTPGIAAAHDRWHISP